MNIFVDENSIASLPFTVAPIIVPSDKLVDVDILLIVDNEVDVMYTSPLVVE
jgi:hypothetical protein